MTGVYVNEWGTWHRVQYPQVNVDGVWLVCKAVWVNGEGIWHKIWEFEAEYMTLPRNFISEREIQDVCACAA